MVGMPNDISAIQASAPPLSASPGEVKKKAHAAAKVLKKCMLPSPGNPKVAPVKLAPKPVKVKRNKKALTPIMKAGVTRTPDAAPT
jgi:hypothetical protein